MTTVAVVVGTGSARKVEVREPLGLATALETMEGSVVSTRLSFVGPNQAQTSQDSRMAQLLQQEEIWGQKGTEC